MLEYLLRSLFLLLLVPLSDFETIPSKGKVCVNLKASRLSLDCKVVHMSNLSFSYYFTFSVESR